MAGVRFANASNASGGGHRLKMTCLGAAPPLRVDVYSWPPKRLRSSTDDKPTVAGSLTSQSEPRLEGDQQVTFLFSAHDPRVVKHARRALNILDGRMVDGAAH